MCCSVDVRACNCKHTIVLQQQRRHHAHMKYYDEYYFGKCALSNVSQRLWHPTVTPWPGPHARYLRGHATQRSSLEEQKFQHNRLPYTFSYQAGWLSVPCTEHQIERSESSRKTLSDTSGHKVRETRFGFKYPLSYISG